MPLNILFLTPRFPYPLVGGDRIKPYNILSYLAKRHKVTLVTFFQGGELPLEYIEAVENIGVEVFHVPLNPVVAGSRILNPSKITLPLEIAYYTQSEYKAIVDRLIGEREFDLAFSFFMRTAEYLKDKPVKKILMAEDCRTLYQRRSFEDTDNLFQKAIRLWEYRLLQRYEPRIVDHFDLTTLVTQQDIEAMNKQNPRAKYRLLTNGTDINRYVPSESNHRKDILFTGKLDVWANILMVRTIVNDILPKVRQFIPDACLNVVGANPAKSIQALASDSVRIIPNVPDLKPYLQQAALFLHPHKGGSGIQNKVLEAMACGCPVVTTKTGNQGIDGRDGHEVLIGKNTDEMISHTVRVLNDPEFAGRLGRNARLLIENTHSWEAVFSALDGIFEELGLEVYG